MRNIILALQSSGIYIYHDGTYRSPIINTLRCLVSVRLSVCDGYGRGRNEFAGRVQNYRVPCAKLSRAFQLSQKFSREIKAAAGQDTQSCRLREGCHCGRLPSH